MSDTVEKDAPKDRLRALVESGMTYADALAAERAEAVLAYRRCADVHPDRHDQGGVGVCGSCRSWAADVTAVLRAELERPHARTRNAEACVIPSAKTDGGAA